MKVLISSVTRLVQERVLIRVKVDTIQEIEPKVWVDALLQEHGTCT